MNGRQTSSIVVGLAIAAIFGLVGLAVANDHDGALLSLGVAAIAALGGVKLRDIFKG